MAKCHICEAQTFLFVGGAPLCLNCVDGRLPAHRPPAVASTCDTCDRLAAAFDKLTREYQAAVRRLTLASTSDYSQCRRLAESARLAAEFGRQELERHQHTHVQTAGAAG